MIILEPIPVESVESWLEDRLAGTPPPAYALEPARASEEAVATLQGLGREVLLRDPNSGAATFATPFGAELFESDDLFGVCRTVDERQYFWTEGRAPDHEGGLPEIRSRLPEGGWPVIGPGGRLLFVPGGELVVGQLIFRRRGEEVAAKGWRLPPSPIERLGLPGDVPVTVFGAVGYFEASAREAQELLRPALVLSIEHRPEPEAELDVGWRQVLVEPVTDIAGFLPEAGLNLWFEPGGVEDG